jgi:putative tricarboxylic transport membrane protein
MAMGVFGYGEIISNLSQPEDDREVFTAKVQGLFPTLTDIKNMMIPAFCVARLWALLLGVLPGGGALLAAFAAYTIEKKTSFGPAKCLSVKAISAVWRPLNRPTMPVRKPPSSPC